MGLLSGLKALRPAVRVPPDAILLAALQKDAKELPLARGYVPRAGAGENNVDFAITESALSLFTKSEKHPTS